MCQVCVSVLANRPPADDDYFLRAAAFAAAARSRKDRLFFRRLRAEQQQPLSPLTFCTLRGFFPSFRLTRRISAPDLSLLGLAGNNPRNSKPIYIYNTFAK